MRLLRLTLLVGAVCWFSAAHAQDDRPLEERFGARAQMIDLKLSPSGNRVALVAPQGDDGETLLIFDIGEGGKWRPILRNDEVLTDLSWCDWTSDDRLICQLRAAAPVDGTFLGLTRLITLRADGSDLEVLTAPRKSGAYGYYQDGGNIVAWNVDGEDANNILMTRQFLKEFSTGTLTARDEEGLGVELVNVETQKRKTVERGRPEAMWYVSDENGTVRLQQQRGRSDGGYLTDQTRYMVRPVEGGSWRQMALGEGAPADFIPVAVDSSANVAYGFGDHQGFDALFSVSLDESGRGRLLLSRPGSDVDQLIRLGQGGRVVGASYATEKRQVEFFDPELSRLSAALGKALPGQPLIELLDASEDESRLLLVASSDTDPGMAYLFDKATRRLEEVIPLRPQLAGLPMGAMTPVSYPAADGTQIPAYLTLPPGSDGRNLPAIVLPHGGPSARDEWGFDWLVQYFVHRGYAVLQPNFRGSAGYGSAWFQKNGFQSWQTAVGDVNDAGRWLVSQGIAQEDRLAIVGWSYGGYAALQSAVLDPQLYKAIIAIAPVTDLARLATDARRFTNYRLVRSFVGEGPHVSAGSPSRHAERFTAPVLLFHGDADENVDVRHSRIMADALRGAGKAVDYVEFKALDHYLDRMQARSAMLGRIEAFLSQGNARLASRK